MEHLTSELIGVQMAKRDLITQEFVKECFNYSPETGVLTRAKRTSNRVNVGDVSGYKNHHGYLMVQVGGVLCSVHRVAWMYVNGVWPSGHLDHINRDRTDNKISNLRDVTPAENQHNSRIPKNNTSGHIGVNWNCEINKWVAKICLNCKQTYLGCFEKLEDAVLAYKTASLKMHPKRLENMSDALPICTMKSSREIKALVSSKFGVNNGDKETRTV
jgi:hypothetical protein